MKYNIILLLPLFSFNAGSCNTDNTNNITRPNILIITSEDHGQHLSCYGDSIIKTPNLDNIAQEGILFRNAYITQSYCSPSRSSILTGLYPHQNGHLGLAGDGHRLLKNVINIYSILKNTGYRTGMIGKLHVEPENSFPIDYWPIIYEGQANHGNFKREGLDRYWQWAETFINASEDPFFLMVNFPDAHWEWEGYEQIDGRPAKIVSQDKVVPFPYIGFDNERIRNITTKYYNCILRLDECIGELIDKLNKSGKKDNTLVIFLSDHGDQMARGKGNVYEAGVKVPFLMMWPDKIPNGIESEALISAIDIVPTILETVKLQIPDNIAGKSLIPLFRNPDLKFREYIVVEQNLDVTEKYFPRRAIRNNKYKLIYSLLDDRSNSQAEGYIKHEIRGHTAFYGCPTLEELKTAPYSIRSMYYQWLHPCKIQLYDLENDPWEFKDLSHDPNYFTIKKMLLTALFDWQEQTNDPLRYPENLRLLTNEVDTITFDNRNTKWRYREYLYKE